MKKPLLILLFITLALCNFAQDERNYDVYWKSGLRADSDDGRFKFKIGGRIQTDVMFINQNDSLDNHFEAYNGVEFRRARIYFSGLIYNNIKFKFQLDFAGGDAVIKDAYIHFIKVPIVGNIKVGNFKEPSGLSMLISSNFLTMMERPLGNVFDNDRNIGLMIYNQYFEQRLSLFAGYFYPTDNSGKYVGNKYHLDFRVCGLPVYNTKSGYKVLHLGASYVYQFHDDTEVKYSVRPESHLAPKYLNVTIDKLNKLNDINTEFLLIYNSFSLESELTYSIEYPGQGSILKYSEYHTNAWHVTFSWFATGEHKNYVKSKTFFDEVTPKRNLGQDGGFGALEFAIRYSSIDLNYKDLEGGKMEDITFGINWYLNPATKIAFNYINSHVNTLGIANIYQMRFQIKF